MGMFFPAMLAVMAFNALILLVLIIVGVVILWKRRKPKVSRKTRGRMSPVPLNRTSRFGAEPHAYEPVSMALSEDTFVPPVCRLHSLFWSSILMCTSFRCPHLEVTQRGRRTTEYRRIPLYHRPLQ
jgi:hypothetical protein